MKKDEQLRREVSFLDRANHPNIVKFYGYFPIDDETTGIAMEICDGTLKDLVAARDLNWLEIAYLSHQMLVGVKYLHDDLKVHHRCVIELKNICQSYKKLVGPQRH